MHFGFVVKHLVFQLDALKCFTARNFARYFFDALSVSRNRLLETLNASGADFSDAQGKGK